MARLPLPCALARSTIAAQISLFAFIHRPGLCVVGRYDRVCDLTIGHVLGLVQERRWVNVPSDFSRIERGAELGKIRCPVQYYGHLEVHSHLKNGKEHRHSPDSINSRQIENNLNERC